jgi:hypothetical protein
VGHGLTHCSETRDRQATSGVHVDGSSAHALFSPHRKDEVVRDGELGGASLGTLRRVGQSAGGFRHSLSG